MGKQNAQTSHCQWPGNIVAGMAQQANVLSGGALRACVCVKHAFFRTPYGASTVKPFATSPFVALLANTAKIEL